MTTVEILKKILEDLKQLQEEIWNVNMDMTFQNGVDILLDSKSGGIRKGIEMAKATIETKIAYLEQ